MWLTEVQLMNMHIQQKCEKFFFIVRNIKISDNQITNQTNSLQISFHFQKSSEYEINKYSHKMLYFQLSVPVPLLDFKTIQQILYISYSYMNLTYRYTHPVKSSVIQITHFVNQRRLFFQSNVPRHNYQISCLSPSMYNTNEEPQQLHLCYLSTLLPKYRIISLSEKNV